jgi:hypothetical protein
MTKSDDKLGVHEELQEADPIPDMFPGQDPKVGQEWEKAKEDPRWKTRSRSPAREIAADQSDPALAGPLAGDVPDLELAVVPALVV